MSEVEKDIYKILMSEVEKDIYKILMSEVEKDITLDSLLPSPFNELVPKTSIGNAQHILKEMKIK